MTTEQKIIKTKVALLELQGNRGILLYVSFEILSNAPVNKSSKRTKLK